jgi:hypothetical protein
LSTADQKIEMAVVMTKAPITTAAIDSSRSWP